MENDEVIGSQTYENTSAGLEVYIKEEPLMLEDDVDSAEFENSSKAFEVNPSITKELSDDETMATTIIKEDCVQDEVINSNAYENTPAGVEFFIKEEPLTLEDDVDSEENENSSKAFEVKPSITKELSDVETIATIIKEECVQDEVIDSNDYENMSAGVQVFIKEEPLMVCRREAHSTMPKDFQFGDSNYEDCSSEGYTPEDNVLEDFVAKQPVPQESRIPECIPHESIAHHSAHGQSKPQEWKEEESMSGASDPEEHTSGDTDERNCEELREKRTGWSVVEVENLSKKKASEGDEEEERVYSCNICGKTFVSQHNIAYHLKFTHSDKKPFQCELCGKTFKMNGQLRSHSKIHSDTKPFECQVCGKSFRFKKILVQHQMVHTGRKKYKCCHCEEMFERKGEFENHQLTHDGSNVVWECGECEDTFGRWKEVVEHREAHLRKKGLTCDVCGRKFRRKGELRHHMYSHTLPHQCNMCDKSFRFAAHLAAHMRTHSGTRSNAGEKAYSCTVCEKSFREKQLLNRHMGCHMEEKPYPCTVCGKRLCDRTSLSRHMWTHTEKKPFPCTLCEKGFIVKQLLVEHMWMHTGEKPYVCEICGRRYTRRPQLHKHLEKDHSKEQPFKCEECELRFDKWKKLQQHKEEEHAKQ